MRLMLAIALCLAGCSNGGEKPAGLPKSKVKLIYFGFDDHSEKQADVLKMADTWAGNSKVCPHWQATVNEKDADYKVSFGTRIETVTIIGSRGEIVYSGGQGPLYLPHGNPNGGGVNICKLTGE
jgi:hypothetical protein